MAKAVNTAPISAPKATLNILSDKGVILLLLILASCNHESQVGSFCCPVLPKPRLPIRQRVRRQSRYHWHLSIAVRPLAVISGQPLSCTSILFQPHKMVELRGTAPRSVTSILSPSTMTILLIQGYVYKVNGYFRNNRLSHRVAGRHIWHETYKTSEA